MNRAIFVNDNGDVSVLIPSDEMLEEFGIQFIAEKDIPAGKKFKIMSAEDIPASREDRKNWDISKIKFDDGIGTADI